MRKQTKFVAVLSAAALLAIGASMTSFAAGWTEENGTWVFYDRNGDLETEKWEKSGENWFWLNEDGEMATSTLVEDGENYYYVDGNGAMVVNRWMSVENDDYDSDDLGSPENYWYYFGSNGRAYKRSANATSASFKTINGKKYIFDEEGHMLYGWINEAGEQETDEATMWQEGIYYCGSENDGAQRSGEWAYLDIVDEDFAADPKGDVSSPNVFDDEEQTRWFYFNTNGKKYADATKTINGAKYDFDVYGRMNVEWVIYTNGGKIAVVPTTSKASPQGSVDYSTKFRYYGSPESGARKTKGWFQVVPDETLDVSNYNDDSDAWYYSDNNGNLVAGEIKTISGKKYAFNNKGAMQTGLKLIKGDPKGGLIVCGLDSSDLPAKVDTEDDFKANISACYEAGFRLYYFGGSSDGSMKTGKQTVTIDGDNFSFLFTDSGSSKGQGVFGLKDKKYYAGGMLMAAAREDKYAVVKVESDADGVTSIEIMDAEDFTNLTTKKSNPGDKYESYWDMSTVAKDTNEVIYRLVNTAGTVQKSKTKAKNGEDYCFTVNKSGEITAVFVES